MLQPPRLDLLRKWNADGVIARLENKHIADIVAKLRLPTVDLRGSFQIPGIAGIFTDDQKVVELAIEHLISNGLKHLAFCGYHGIDFSDARHWAFIQDRKYEHGTRHVFDSSEGKRRKPMRTYEGYGSADFTRLQSWLTHLPKPVGVLACNDTRGRQVLEACAAAGLRVPYDVAVIGVDNDDVQCELSYPTLSGVAPNVEAIGFDAAALLDRILSGRPAPRKPLFISPISVEVRGSSDMTALTDPRSFRPSG